MLQKTFLFFSIAILGSCASIKPETPDSIIKTIPTLDQPLSVITVPIKVNLTPYFKETDKSIPKKFSGKQENCDGVSFSYNFKREPIQFDGKGKYLNFEVDGAYALKLNYCPSCHDLFGKEQCAVPRVYVSCGVDEDMRKITVAYKTKLNITPDFKLKAETDLIKVEPKDPCEISLFKYDATKTLKQEVTKALKGLESTIDKEIGKVELKKQAEEAWKLLSNPIQLGKYGYLNAHPSKLNIDNLFFDGVNAKLNLSLGFYPTFTSIPEEKNGKTELPKLSNFKNDEGFNVCLDINANYDSLSTILTNEFKGKIIDLKGKKIIFNNIKIYSAASEKINFEISFSGSKKGVLYLVGTPTFDKTSQSISFPDVEFDLKTKNLLLKSVKWLFNDKITEAFKTYSSLDLKPHLDQIKTSVNKELNKEIQKGIFLKGKIDNVNIESIYPSNSSLILRVKSNGYVNIEL